MAEELSTQEYSDEVLEETPARVTKFLLGISGNAVIKTLLFEEGGMTLQDVEEGGELLKQCTSLSKAPAPELDTPEAKARRHAAALLDAADESLFARTNAALKRKHKSARAYIFQGGLKASQSLAAVHGMSLYCTRVRALHEGSDPKREGTRDEDKQAVALLGARKITMANIADLERQIAIALGQEPTPEGANTTPTNPTEDDQPERRQRLVNIKEWYDDWAETARSILKKKLHRIQVGISQRASKHDPTPPAT